MKILLANPPCRISISPTHERFFIRAGSRWPFSTVKKKKEKIGYAPFPFYMAYAAALLKNEGFDLEVIDAIALNLTLTDFTRKAVGLKPDVILYETSTPTISHDLKLARVLKKKTGSLICLAGPHVTVYPEEILKKNPAVDFVFLQEYELAFLELAKRLKNKKNLKGIAGLAYRRGKKIIVGKPAAIDPLDQLPFPSRALFPSEGADFRDYYWISFRVFKPAIQMHSSRGCPYRCNFCLWNQVMYGGGKYRTFSPERVVDEMEDCVKKFGAKEIYFDDDSFTINKKHVLGICREIKRRKLKIKWSCMGNIEPVDREMISRMAESGCLGFCFGVESGSPEILRKIGKTVDLEKVKRVVAWCSEYKIKTHGTFIFGLSGDTRETMIETLDYAKSLDIDSLQFSISTPFPGTRFYDEVKKARLLRSNHWQDYDGALKSVVKFKNISAREIQELCQKASGVWLKAKLKDPRWVYRQFYYMGRSIRGQGPGFLVQRLKRTVELLLK